MKEKRLRAKSNQFMKIKDWKKEQGERKKRGIIQESFVRDDTVWGGKCLFSVGNVGWGIKINLS